MDELNAHRLRVHYGPHLVRVTRQDMQPWMPEVRPAQPLALDPDPALRELLDAIRRGGQQAYGRLLEILRELKRTEAGSVLYRQALAELARAQGVVLGNVGVYVDASVDPETLTHSKAALATALVRQGLVGEAVRGGGDGLPLLRGVTAQTLAGVAGEEQVIVFAERVWCLRQLAHTLRERHGVQAHVADGSITTVEFEELKRRFTAGEFPVLCLSRIGHEGHNLQNASVLCHLDLPWLPSGLEQRVGRAARPGAARAQVQTYIPYIRGGGIEHVVSVLAERGAEHHQILDSFEGVRASREHGRDAAVRDHRAGRREQARRRLPGDRRPPTGRRQRLRRLTATHPTNGPLEGTVNSRERRRPGGARPITDHSFTQGDAHERNQRCPVADRRHRRGGRPRARPRRDPRAQHPRRSDPAARRQADLPAVPARHPGR